MKGTEKQIKWAIDLKGKAVADLEKQTARFIEGGRAQGATEQQIAEFSAEFESRLGALVAIDDAAWWIDNRNLTSKDLLKQANGSK